MGTATSTCQCVPKPAASCDTAQAEPSTVMCFLCWLIELSWVQKPSNLPEGSYLAHQKLAGSHISANCSPLPCSSEISLKKQQFTQSLRKQVNKPEVCSSIKIDPTLSWDRKGEAAGWSLQIGRAWTDRMGICWKLLMPPHTSLPRQIGAHPGIAPHICVRLHMHEVNGN